MFRNGDKTSAKGYFDCGKTDVYRKTTQTSASVRPAVSPGDGSRWLASKIFAQEADLDVEICTEFC